MHSLKATFFVFLYLLAMVRPIVPLASFVVNQDYIAEFLCINQDKPELNCNGKCYLMQKLDEQNEEKRQNLPRISMEEYPIGFVRFMTIDLPEKITTSAHNFTNYQNNYRFIYSDNQYRPPAL